MRVLLVSPIDPEVPTNLRYLMGGENTYTRTLLAHSPPSVEYVHYSKALESGEIRKGSFNDLLNLLTKFRMLPLSAGTIDIELVGNFDLVHCHAYTLRLSGKGRRRVPIVMGDSIPTRWSLREYFKQNGLRISVNFALRDLIHRRLSVYDQDLFLGDFSKLIVMSEFAKREHVGMGGDASRISVVYPGLPDRGEKKRRKNRFVNILFAGVWFERKGGLILLEAYKKLRERFGDRVRLTILGPFSKGVQISESDLKSLRVLHHDFVSYSRLVGEFYPACDVLVHVPPKAEGFGLVVAEAMSFGVPVVASSVGALGEMVSDGKNGLLIRPGSVDALVKALNKLVKDKGLRERLGRGARKRYLDRFHLKVMHKKLTSVYDEAISNFKSLK